MKSNMIRYINLLLTILCSVVFAACENSGADEPYLPEQEDSPADSPTPIGTRRTVVVYMVASNSLGSYPDSFYDNVDRINMADMERWASSHSLNDCNIIVYYVSRGTNPVPQLLRLTANGFVNEKDYAPLGSDTYVTHPDVMAANLKEIRQMYPADEYGLILWSHGLAWVAGSNSFTPDDMSVEKRSWGEDRGKSLSIPALAAVLELEGENAWDFIYFDSCYGINIETVYEMRHTTPCIIGSTTEIPSDGMPYFDNMPNLVANEIDPIALAHTTFAFYDERGGINRSCTMSVVATDKLDALAAVCRDIHGSGAYTDASYRGICYSLDNTYTYDMADIYHNMEGISADNLERFDRALADAVVYHVATPKMWSSIDLSRYCGMGQYIIRYADTANRLGYGDLQWWTDVMRRNIHFQ